MHGAAGHLVNQQRLTPGSGRAAMLRFQQQVSWDLASVALASAVQGKADAHIYQASAERPSSLAGLMVGWGPQTCHVPRHLQLWVRGFRSGRMVIAFP